MPVYSFYIFDRHAECIYQRRWDAQPSTPAPSSRPTSGGGTPADTAPPAPVPYVGRRGKESDTAKLVFGVIFSLRNIVRRLGGDEDEFISYRTGEYKLHYYETPTSMKFVMLTDVRMSDLRVYLHQIWANLYVEYVVKNPLSPVEHPGGVGVNNELFELGLTRFIDSVFQS